MAHDSRRCARVDVWIDVHSSYDPPRCIRVARQAVALWPVSSVAIGISGLEVAGAAPRILRIAEAPRRRVRIRIGIAFNTDLDLLVRTRRRARAIQSSAPKRPRAVRLAANGPWGRDEWSDLVQGRLQAYARVGRVRAHDHVPGARRRAASASVLFVAQQDGSLIVGAGRRRGAEADVEVRVARAARDVAGCLRGARGHLRCRSRSRPSRPTGRSPGRRSAARCRRAAGWCPLTVALITRPRSPRTS